MKLLDKNKVYTVAEAAKYYGVCTETLRRWDREGTLVARRMGNDHRYYLKKDLKDIPVLKEKKKEK
jgi:excisionase family DNA binding protein